MDRTKHKSTWSISRPSSVNVSRQSASEQKNQRANLKDEQVFPNLVVVGWFTTGSSPDAWTSTLHASLPSAIFDNPLLLLLDPQQLTTATQQSQEEARHATQLPLRVFEKPINTVMSMEEEEYEQRHPWAELAWKLETGEAERIAVDHISKAQNTSHATGQESDSAETDARIAHLNAHANAIKMLRSRISLMRAYVGAVQAGTVEADAEIIKGMVALLQRLPVQQTVAFQRESQRERQAVLGTQQAAEIMTGGRLLGELIDMYAAVKSTRRSRGGAARNAVGAATTTSSGGTSTAVGGEYGAKTREGLPTGWV